MRPLAREDRRGRVSLTNLSERRCRAPKLFPELVRFLEMPETPQDGQSLGRILTRLLEVSALREEPAICGVGMGKAVFGPDLIGHGDARLEVRDRLPSALVRSICPVRELAEDRVAFACDEIGAEEGRRCRATTLCPSPAGNSAP